MKKILLLIFIGIASQSFAQDNMAVFVHKNKFLVPEGNLGLVSRENEKSQLIGGFGLWNYLRLDEFQGKRKSAIGLSVPIRLGILSLKNNNVLGYEYSLSVASMFRVMIQQHPVKETFWFFMGAGPELRTTIENETEKELNLFFIQQEFGFKIFNPNAILPDNEIGFSISWPVNKEDWEEQQRFVLFFARLAIF